MLPAKILTGLALCTVVAASHADSPLPPPFPHRVSSPNGKFAVISDPGNGTRVVESQSGRTVCQIPGWFRSLHLADDGEHLAIGYGGLNLIPPTSEDSLELITFWTRCRKTKSVPLTAIVPDRSVLRRTTSHYEWGSITGIEQGNHLMVTRIDGRVFRFNMVSGEADRGPLSADDKDALDVSETLLRNAVNAWSFGYGRVRVVCLHAYVKEHVPLLVERLRGSSPVVRDGAQCGSSLEEYERVRLGFPIKEGDDAYLQSIDAGEATNCVYELRRSADGKWLAKIKIRCAISIRMRPPS